MSSTLSEGVRVPDIGSVNWGADVNFNWGLLNTALANISGNVKTDVANTWTATQTFSETISGSIDGVAARAVNDEDGNNIKTALAGKATDDQVVHKAGAETIPGDKTWTGANTFTRINFFENIYDKVQSTAFDVRTDPETNRGGDLFRIWDGTASARGNYLGGISFYQNADGSTRLQLICFGYPQTGNARQNRINFHSFRDGSAFFNPGDNGNINLGSSTNKWKTLNGINPGALSFPAVSGAISIDTTDWYTAYNQPNDLKINDANPSYPGWLFIRLDNCTAEDDFLIVRYISTNQANPTFYGSFIQTATSFVLTTPIPAGVTIKVWVSKLPSYCKYFPCLGNV